MKPKKKTNPKNPKKKASVLAWAYKPIIKGTGTKFYVNYFGYQSKKVTAHNWEVYLNDPYPVGKIVRVRVTEV